MSPRSGEFWPPSRPLAVDGGLAARSTRGAIGEQWWSRRFLDVLESLALGTRLTRGKNYARRGQVMSLDVSPGEVRAVVQGSRPSPYAVSIRLPVFSGAVWDHVEEALAEQAIHSARLLAGELPPDLENVFAAAGAPFFPQRAKDLTQHCSCPDRAVPCKHLAATFYLLAERFDEDPFLILLWRGRRRDDLLSRLRELRGGGSAVAVEPGNTDVPRIGAAMALADVNHAVGDFWDGAPIPPLPVQPALPVDVLLRQLPDPGPALGGAAFREFLEPLYARLGEDPVTR